MPALQINRKLNQHLGLGLGSGQAMEDGTGGTEAPEGKDTTEM